jgi:hypothetical protein
MDQLPAYFEEWREILKDAPDALLESIPAVVAEANERGHGLLLVLDDEPRVLISDRVPLGHAYIYDPKRRRRT